jgi:hypothetical protein
VNYVQAEKNRDVQPGFIHCNVLKAVDRRRVVHPQHRAAHAFSQQVFRLGAGEKGETSHLRQLADLLFQHHLRHERIHLLLHLHVSERRRRRLARGRCGT